MSVALPFAPLKYFQCMSIDGLQGCIFGAVLGCEVQQTLAVHVQRLSEGHRNDWGC